MLAGSRAARAHGLSPTVTHAWMEAARRRGLIARSSDDTDVAGRPLPAPEWELTARGHDRPRHEEHHAESLRLAKWLLATGAPIGTVLALLRAGGIQTLASDLLFVLIGVVLFALAVIVLGLAPHPRFTKEILSVAVPEIERRAAAQHAEAPAPVN